MAAYNNAYVENGYTMWCYFLSYYINHLNNISSSARLEAQWCVFSKVSLIENIALACVPDHPQHPIAIP